MKQSKNKLIFLIILLFFFAKLIFFNKNVWWDSAVYIGMGKYIYSFGRVGLWEASRPVVWPLILGLLWKLNLDVVFYPKMVELLFSAGCIYFTCLIGREVFNDKIALLSAFFVAFSPTFFNYTTIALTEIPSLFFGLAAVYYFIRRNFLFAGVLSGISFMTRFLQFGIFLILFLFLLSEYNRKNLINLFYLILGFVLTILPYLLFNYFSYNNLFYPFFLQTFLTKYTGWMYHQPFWFYFLGLFKENILFVFAIIGLFLIINAGKYKKKVIFFIFSLFFIFFILIKHKEMRFIITFLPYLSLITAYGIYSFLDKIKNRNVRNTIFIIAISVFLIQSFFQFEAAEIIDYSFFYEHLDKENPENIWITNPVYIVDSNKKAELIYSPSFDSTRIKELRGDITNANSILMNTCDITCPPWDNICSNEKPIFIEELKKKFKLIAYK